jgi:zinc D-Ala-D-Ala dipeptidase
MAGCNSRVVRRLSLGLFVSVTIAQDCSAACITKRPGDLVYLRAVEPSIVQDMRYAQWHNFIGHKIIGYDAAECILTLRAAKALQKVQRSLSQNGHSLKVYDCYRPDRASHNFVDWAKDSQDSKMKAEFYPTLKKSQLVGFGYVATKSAHSRGSTVDIAIITQPPGPQPVPQVGDTQKPCISSGRFRDNSIDFGTGYDCLDEASHTNSPAISEEAKKNRRYLVSEMLRGGFQNYYREWWHFTLSDEPYPNTCFDFPITNSP